MLLLTIQLEQIPSSFQDSIIVPIYKGMKKYPPDEELQRYLTFIYIGILFESILLLRMIPLRKKKVFFTVLRLYQASMSHGNVTEVIKEGDHVLQ